MKQALPNFISSSTITCYETKQQNGMEKSKRKGYKPAPFSLEKCKQSIQLLQKDKKHLNPNR